MSVKKTLFNASKGTARFSANKTRKLARFARSRSLVALGICAAMTAGVAQAQSVWNNAGTDWSTGANWTPNTVPSASVAALFNANGSAATSAATQPNLSAASDASSLSLFQSQTGGGWNFTGAQTLTIGATGSTGITASGPANHTFSDQTLAGASVTNTLSLTATNGSTLTLAGNTTALTNLSALTAGGSVAGVNVTGGRFVLDNSTTDVPNRLSTTSTIKQNGGGTFELIGNSAGGTYNVGLYNTTDNSIGGVNTIRVTSNSTTANTTLNFANTGAFSIRQGTRNITVFSSNGDLGSVNGPAITFNGTLGSLILSNGIVANSATTPGFAIVNDANGVNFATYSTARGVQSVSSPTQTTATVTTATTAAQLQTFTAAGATGTIGQFNIPASTTETATANIAASTLRISPAGSGSSLAMGTFNLLPAAIMLDGPNDFSITGTGTLFAGSHYLYVNDPNATLSLQPTLTTGGNAVAFAGPGFLDLTGTVNQNLATTQRIGVYGGVLRANNTQIGFSGASQGILTLMGGVLEIKNGSNGTGASADFTRPLGQTSSVSSGVVNFNSATAEQGSGGFSAYGANASVNIGGAASPSTLQWAQTNFVGNGYALKFGSTKSDAALTFLNPINLENGTAYQQREINVTDNTSSTADKTVLGGVISGATGVADLLKTGNGVLELTAANTYTGTTRVSAGILVVTGSVAGPATVLTNGTLGGSGSVAGLTTVLDGTLAPGNSAGTLTLGNGLTLTSASLLSWELNPLDQTAGSNINDLTAITGDLTLDGTINITPTSGNFLGLTSGTWTLATYSGTLTDNGLNAGMLPALDAGYNWTLAAGGGTVTASITAIPEPTTWALVGIAAGGICLRARRRKLQA